ncbi:MAG: hypothetical protein L0323_21715 [Planctomycetes bacterium]|nr:hypothetical protein [Planctomycetota bacterium]
MSRRALRAAALGALLLPCGGCGLLALPIQILRLVLEGLFRLGNAAVQGLGSAGQSLVPYLLFFTVNDSGLPAEGGEVEEAILAAARARPAVEVGLDRALASGPAEAETVLLVPLEAILEPGGPARIARRLHGHHLLRVTFARLPEPGPPECPRTVPAGSPSILEVAPRSGSRGG